MNVSHEDQINYAKIALELLDQEKTNAKNIETILEFGELIKKYADDDNAVIYSTTEYLYEQLRLLRGEDGAFDDAATRAQLEQDIASH